MEFWQDTKQPIDAFLKMFEKCMVDPELSAGLKKVNQVILFDYTQDGPDCSFWIDTRGGKLTAGAGKPSDKPDLIMSLSADDAHRSWSNKLNPVMAITRGKIKVKGSATGLLKLAPKLKRVAELYNEVLQESGQADKILK
ncbi:MAG: SCP2 sterol-binding domain-containing protein [Deltaproteobacteria bacterium]|nr:SCP2 sterol-binding domain-containing protein [Candidatus Zymogenaceae bacterium]